MKERLRQLIPALPALAALITLCAFMAAALLAQDAKDAALRRLGQAEAEVGLASYENEFNLRAEPYFEKLDALIDGAGTALRSGADESALGASARELGFSSLALALDSGENKTLYGPRLAPVGGSFAETGRFVIAERDDTGGLYLAFCAPASFETGDGSARAVLAAVRFDAFGGLIDTETASRALISCDGSVLTSGGEAKEENLAGILDALPDGGSRSLDTDGGELHVALKPLAGNRLYLAACTRDEAPTRELEALTARFTVSGLVIAAVCSAAFFAAGTAIVRRRDW